MRLRLIAVLATLALSLAAAVPSAGAAVATGRVVKGGGYTLLAMAHNGRATSIKLPPSGSFRVKIARDVTLQLLAPDNRFFGPIVLSHSGARGARAYEAFSGRGSASLGAIRLLSAYAAPARSLASKLVDPRVWAHASRSGKPVGAGNLGLLPKHGAHAASAGAGGNEGGQGESGAPLPPGGDPTHVGIITAFNADVTGAGVPNAENPKSAMASGTGLLSEMFQPLQASVNADATSVTPAEISSNVRENLHLDFYLSNFVPGASSVTVDCGTLVYCAAGTGTATVAQSNNTNGIAPGTRWDGTVPSNPNSANTFSIAFAPNAGTEQIRPGDVFQVHYHTATGELVLPTSLTLFPVTVPALASYDVGSGPQTVSYPASATAPGTQGNPIVVSSGKITLSIFRPQRLAFPGESGSFFDLGHLHYGITFITNGGASEVGCASQFLSNLSSTLRVNQSSSDNIYNSLFPLEDTANDAPTPTSPFSLTLDLAGCLSANGISTTQPVTVQIAAVDAPRPGGTDHFVQTFIALG